MGLRRRGHGLGRIMERSAQTAGLFTENRPGINGESRNGHGQRTTAVPA